MNKSCICYLFSLFIFFIVGCSSYEIKSESIPITPLNKYHKIHVDWLDLKEQNWMVYGYGSAKEWKQEINDQNVDGFFKYIKEALPDREYSFASSASDDDDKNMELNIKISVLGLKYQIWPRVILLSTEVYFIDVKTNQKIYTVSLTTEGVGFNFEDKLNTSVFLLAQFITDKFK